MIEKYVHFATQFPNTGDQRGEKRVAKNRGERLGAPFPIHIQPFFHISACLFASQHFYRAIILLSPSAWIGIM